MSFGYCCFSSHYLDIFGIIVVCRIFHDDIFDDIITIIRWTVGYSFRTFAFIAAVVVRMYFWMLAILTHLTKNNKFLFANLRINSYQLLLNRLQIIVFFEMRLPFADIVVGITVFFLERFSTHQDYRACLLNTFIQWRFYYNLSVFLFDTNIRPTESKIKATSIFIK